MPMLFTQLAELQLNRGAAESSCPKAKDIFKCAGQH
jgi:hypothetical protein